VCPYRLDPAAMGTRLARATVPTGADGRNCADAQITSTQNQQEKVRTRSGNPASPGSIRQ
jgi:hypothetical protein